jgi:5-methyltetrahydropteroyltriglutamate--homocysteine methyltransferase
MEGVAGGEVAGRQADPPRRSEHATNVVEHPELVAERILRFAKLVGRERVVASTDCGLGGRVHPQITWAKLEALAQGAALATRELWR